MVAPTMVHPFPGESPAQMTLPARVHQALLEDRPPQEIYDAVMQAAAPADRTLAQTVRSLFQDPRVDRKARQARLHAEGVRRAELGAPLGAITGGLLAAVLGLAVVPAAAAGAAALAALGYISLRYQSRRQDTGNVQIERNGQTRTERWTMDPRHVEASSARLLAELEARGLLGDEVTASTIQTPLVTTEQLQAVTPFVPQLQALDTERRLVADLGHQSRYGHDVLDQIDADAARRLLATGHPIYVVNGGQVEDTPDRVRMHATSVDHQLEVHEQVNSVQRTFPYQLTRIQSPAELSSVQPANGMPEALAGVYQHADRISQTVYANTHEFTRQTDWDRQTYHQKSSEVVRPGGESAGSSPADEMPQVPTSYGWREIPREPRVRTFGYTGACVAGVLAAGVGIFATATGLALGPVAGSFVIASLFAGTYIGGCIGSMREKG